MPQTKSLKGQSSPVVISGERHQGFL